MDKNEVIRALDLIAAAAAKLARDIEANKTWPGDVERLRAVIANALVDVREPR